MRHYDFRCEKCGEEFPLWTERAIAIGELVRDDEISDIDGDLLEGVCPVCGHDKFRRIFSPHPVHSSWIV